MHTAKLFANGNSQAVRLPREFRFEGEEVVVRRVGDAVLLLPLKHSAKELKALLAGFDPDFKLKVTRPKRQRGSRVVFK